MYYPTIDPVIFSIGPVSIRWYGMAYVVAFVTCFLLGRHRIKKGMADLTVEQWADAIFFGTCGTLIGGRLGYALFYDLGHAIEDPLWVLRIWEGGMSFHGGLIGVLVALLLWSRLRGKTFFQVADFTAPLVSVGIGLGRLGNFANTELPGRVTESFLGVYFPCESVVALNPSCFGEFDTVTRHVSSLYQALVTGVVVFLIVWVFSAKRRRLGSVSGMFLAAYGAGRFFTEFFREPDSHLGFIFGEWLTMGQLLSVPLIVIGVLLMLPSINKRFQTDQSS